MNDTALFAQQSETALIFLCLVVTKGIRDGDLCPGKPLCICRPGRKRGVCLHESFKVDEYALCKKAVDLAIEEGYELESVSNWPKYRSASQSKNVRASSSPSNPVSPSFTNSGCTECASLATCTAGGLCPRVNAPSRATCEGFCEDCSSGQDRSTKNCSTVECAICGPPPGRVSCTAGGHCARVVPPSKISCEMGGFCKRCNPEASHLTCAAHCEPPPSFESCSEGLFCPSCPPVVICAEPASRKTCKEERLCDNCNCPPPTSAKTCAEGNHCESCQPQNNCTETTPEFCEAEGMCKCLPSSESCVEFCQSDTPLTNCSEPASELTCREGGLCGNELQASVENCHRGQFCESNCSGPASSAACKAGGHCDDNCRPGPSRESCLEGLFCQDPAQDDGESDTELVLTVDSVYSIAGGYKICTSVDEDSPDLLSGVRNYTLRLPKDSSTDLSRCSVLVVTASREIAELVADAMQRSEDQGKPVSGRGKPRQESQRQSLDGPASEGQELRGAEDDTVVQRSGRRSDAALGFVTAEWTFALVVVSASSTSLLVVIPCLCFALGRYSARPAE